MTSHHVLALTLFVSLATAVAAAEARPPHAPLLNCDAVMKKPIGQQTQAEYDTCSKPALQKALCDAVEEAARSNGCGQSGAKDPRCLQLSRVLITCLRGGPAAGPQQPASR